MPASRPFLSKTGWTPYWNKKNKPVIKLDTKHGRIYFTPAGNRSTLTKQECKEHLSAIENCAFDDFDTMMERVNSIHMIKINTFELSECNCFYWLKNFKCNHAIAIASRLGLCDFSAIIMTIPLERKRKIGEIKRSIRTRHHNASNEDSRRDNK